MKIAIRARALAQSGAPSGGSTLPEAVPQTLEIAALTEVSTPQSLPLSFGSYREHSPMSFVALLEHLPVRF